MKVFDVIQEIRKHKLIAVIRADSKKEGFLFSEAAIKGGLKIIEITFTTPKAAEIIHDLKQAYPEATIGAGTILDETTAKIALDAGADFIVTPHFDPDVIKMCHLYQVPIIPGAADLNGVVKCLKSGCSIIKLFPANLLSSSVVKTFKGPLPQANFIPTGGINAENVQEWLETGVVAVGIGSDLINEAKLTGDVSHVTKYASRLVSSLKEKVKI